MITKTPNDKFAFLFTGNISNAVYLKDMENIYQTLTKYYNYIPGNIWLVFGSDPTGLTDFATNYPGLNAAPVKRYLGTSNPSQDLFDAFTKDDPSPSLKGFFNHILTSPDPDPSTNDDIKNGVLIYFTGEGAKDVSDNGQIMINESGDFIEIGFFNDPYAGPASTSGVMNCFYPFPPDPTVRNLTKWCNINVVMQQSYGELFLSMLNMVDNRSFTAACGEFEGSPDTDTTFGSLFTYGWVKALQFNKIPVSLPPGMYDGKYADEINGSTDLLISMEDAKKFSVEFNIANSVALTTNPVYSELGTDHFLGKPEFLIRDGNHETLTDNPWESPDIYLTHPNNAAMDADPINVDLYVQDAVDAFDNYVNVRILNIGSHPLRKFYVGVTRYNSGVGGLGENRVNTVELTSEVLCPIPLPSDETQLADTSPELFSYVTEFNDIRFPETTHRCIRAVAQLDEIAYVDNNNNDLLTWPWSYQTKYDEAQRNIDFSSVSESSGGGKAPEPGDGNVPEEPENIPEDTQDDEANEKMNNNLNGFKEHIYEIRNPYKDKRNFKIVFPKEYLKTESKLIEFQWFEYHENRPNRLIPLKISEKPNFHIEFDLEPNESKKILIYFALKPRATLDKLISLPFEILTEIQKYELNLKNIRRSVFGNFKKEYGVMGGITLKIQPGSGSLSGTVIDSKGNSVKNAMIIIQSANKRQGAIFRTAGDGTYNIPKINPDMYLMMAITDKWHTKKRSVNLSGVIHQEKNNIDFTEKDSQKGVPVKIIFDKIRINDNHESYFDDTGEFVFTSIVIPDKDEKRKQITHIPEKKYFSISDKKGRNEVDLGITVFDGYAVESLLFAINGKEIDFFRPNDKLNRFQRFFDGNPEKWYGKYKPDDERNDRENLDDWEIWYRILRI